MSRINIAYVAFCVWCLLAIAPATGQWQKSIDWGGAGMGKRGSSVINQDCTKHQDLLDILKSLDEKDDRIRQLVQGCRTEFPEYRKLSDTLTVFRHTLKDKVQDPMRISSKALLSLLMNKK